MVELILAAIAVLLFFIYRKISQAMGSTYNQDLKDRGIKDLIEGTNYHLNEVSKNTGAIADYFQSNAPAGGKSICELYKT